MDNVNCKCKPDAVLHDINHFIISLAFITCREGRHGEGKIKDRYLLPILNRWHGLVNIKMTPKIKSVCHKIYTRFNKWHVILCKIELRHD